MASEKFLEAAQRVSGKRTIDALMLLAENYEYRAKVARARNPNPVEKRAGAKGVIEGETLYREDQTEDLDKEQKDMENKAGALDPEDGHKVETELHVAATEMEELWRRLNEIGLSCPGSVDKVIHVEEGITRERDACSSWYETTRVVCCRTCSCRRAIYRRRWEIRFVCCLQRRGAGVVVAIGCAEEGRCTMFVLLR